MDQADTYAGKTRAARWRAALAAQLVGAVLLAVLLAACGTQAQPAATGSDRHDAPTASDPSPVTVEEIAGRSYTALGVTQFAGPSVSSTMVRGCDTSTRHCDAAVLLTHDGWATRVARVVPRAHWVWTWLLPDGSVAFAPDGEQAPGVLHRDGTVTPLLVSTKPAATGDHAVLTTGPPLLAEGPPVGTVWALDTVAATLRPLSASLPEATPGPPPITVGRATFVSTWQRTGHRMLATVLRTVDGGRTWGTLATVRSRSADAGMPGGLVPGPDGRLALWFSNDGATLSPLIELWTSRDSGRSWTRMQPTRQPTFVSGMAYLPDGTLLMVEERGRAEDPDGMWRTTEDGTDLEPAPQLPVGTGLTASGGVLYQEVPDGLLVSEDGVTWTDVELP